MAKHNRRKFLKDSGVISASILAMTPGKENSTASSKPRKLVYSPEVGANKNITGIFGSHKSCRACLVTLNKKALLIGSL